MRRRPSGSLLITLSVSAVILFASSFYFLKSLQGGAVTTGVLSDTATAEWYAIELLEFFRSHTSDQLKAYLALNPFQDTTCPGCGPYPLCAHVNYLDRKEGKILNEDPLAYLPSPNLMDAGDGALKANRYYQVSVVDMTGTATDDAMRLQKNFCAMTAKQVYLSQRTPVPGETKELGAQDRFLVTVGVTWVPKGKTVAEERHVVLTTLLPNP